MSSAVFPAVAPGEPSVAVESMADIVSRLGDVPLARIRLLSPARPATDEDVLLLAEKYGILCELVDGILVEKPIGLYESRVAAVLIYLLESYLEQSPRGITAGESGPVRTTGKQIRMPDVSFVSGERLSAQMLRTQKVLHLCPDLAIEVLSESNTKREMDSKLREYFKAGTKLVWYIDPQTETALVYRSPDRCETISGDQELVGHDVLPGFAVQLSQVFQRAKRGLPPTYTA